ncbi:MAG TPA: hypothetical protein VKV57_12780 [bacterium]|nr:hypothetical protein [bacterium]
MARVVLMAIGCLIAGAPLLLLPPSVFAHTHRKAGGYEMTVGWADEPVYAGLKNGVQLLLKDSGGKPVTDLGDTLTVEVIFGKERMPAQPLTPAFEKSIGTPGDYRAAIIPTRPGNYTFHFVGTIGTQKVDESFTSSETTFDPVVDPSAIEFPAKDPSIGEIAGHLDRLGPRIDGALSAARDASAGASQARVVGIAGVALGTAGLVAGFAGRRRTVR